MQSESIILIAISKHMLYNIQKPGSVFGKKRDLLNEGDK